MKENSEKLFLKKEGMLWRPVFTLARNEKKIYALLKEKGIDAYLPLRTHVNIQPVISKGKNYCYKRKLAVPMFSNYLFACLSYDSCSELQRNRSVIRVLPVSDIQEDALMNELKMIQALEIYSENAEIDVSNGIVRGPRVKFIDGQFAGWEGIAVDEADNKGFVYINISSVEANIGLRYPAKWCEAIGETAN